MRKCNHCELKDAELKRLNDIIIDQDIIINALIKELAEKLKVDLGAKYPHLKSRFEQLGIHVSSMRLVQNIGTHKPCNEPVKR